MKTNRFNHTFKYLFTLIIAIVAWSCGDNNPDNPDDPPKVKRTTSKLVWNQTFANLEVGDVVALTFTCNNTESVPEMVYDHEIVNVTYDEAAKKWNLEAMAQGTTMLTISYPESEHFTASESISKEITVVEIPPYHFDLWVALDKHGGIGRDVQTLVRSLYTLDADQPEISFKGEGTEVNSILSLETIVKGVFYYQVPVSGDRFAKYIIQDNKVTRIAACPFSKNSYVTRKYTFAWLDETTLLIMAANGSLDAINWTKLNSDNMTILEEGTLDLPLPEGAVAFTTSGIAAYRPSDNRLFYFYYGKDSGGNKGAPTSPFWVATIDPATMEVKTNEINSCGVGEMAGSAYGELLQTITFIDGSNNLYLAAFTETENGEKSYLLRIANGQVNFETDYNGFDRDGKLISILYLDNGKAIAYARYDSIGTLIDSFAHYYSVIDLATCEVSPLQYNGEDLPYSGGRFSSRMAVRDGVAYVGVDPQGTHPTIYIYDVNDGSVIKGADMAQGYYFEQIRILDNYKQ